MYVHTTAPLKSVGFVNKQGMYHQSHQNWRMTPIVKIILLHSLLVRKAEKLREL